MHVCQDVGDSSPGPSGQTGSEPGPEPGSLCDFSNIQRQPSVPQFPCLENRNDLVGSPCGVNEKMLSSGLGWNSPS